MIGLHIAGAMLSLYAFAIVCGAFSYLFVDPSSFGLLARDSIVGLCAVCLPAAALTALIFYGFVRRVWVCVDIFGAFLIVLTSAASGFGRLIFSMPDAGMSILTCMVGGLFFSGVGCLLYCLVSECTRANESCESCAANDEQSTTDSACTPIRAPEESK